MKFCVYRSERKDGLYVFTSADSELGDLPEDLRQQVAPLTLALEIDLEADSKLSRENPQTVLANIATQGYHLQMPEQVESLLNRHRST
ncbi:MAG: YcgL domain-containing protein [Pseudomonadota bacterium]